MFRRRRARRRCSAVMVTLWWSSTAFAQLDPLLFIKRVPADDHRRHGHVDAHARGRQRQFLRSELLRRHRRCRGDGVISAINAATTKTYRRVYSNLQYAASPGKYTANSITATAAAWDPANALTSNAATDVAFLNNTRYNIAKTGLSAAVTENGSSTFRWGLIKLRQNTPAWRTGCELRQACPGQRPGPGCFTRTRRRAMPAQRSATTPSTRRASPRQTMRSRRRRQGPSSSRPRRTPRQPSPRSLRKGPNDATALIPAGTGGVGYEDRPINYALVDAKAAAVAAMASGHRGQPDLPQHGRRADHRR